MVSMGAPDAVQREAYLMGTLCTIQGVASRRDQGLAAIEAGFSAIEATEALLSTWRTDTPLARLGRAQVGQAVEVPPALARLLAAARETWKQSGGGFDPAIGALVQAWDLRGPGRVPTPAELARALASSGMDRVVVDTSRATVTLKAAGLSFDAGGFGKGAGLARAGDALTRKGLRNWLIDFGGQVLVDPDGPGRDIPIAHPRDRARPVAILHLRGLSAATSSQGQRPGHILDPR
ncbi:MAG: FAD:protein FMN transferase, partial [Acidobacteria bacterium]|nr:FAD:protein FMN transferase [Acidobacteriota bacterium]